MLRNYFGIENIRQDKESSSISNNGYIDALGAKYDYPASLKTVRKWANCLGMKNFEVKRGDNVVSVKLQKISLKVLVQPSQTQFDKVRTGLISISLARLMCF